MSGEVDQNIDLVGPDAIRQPVVGPLQSVSPPIGDLSERVRDGILFWAAGVTNNFVLRPVVVRQHRPDCARRRAIPEFGRYIAQHNPSGRIAIVLVLRWPRGGNLCPNPTPPLRSCRLMRGE